MNDCPPSDARKDPVCNIPVDNNLTYTCQYEGETFYFCGADCEARFRTNPDKYLSS